MSNDSLFEFDYAAYQRSLESAFAHSLGYIGKAVESKSRPDLFPPDALAVAGEVLAFGLQKHPSEPWKTMSVDDHLGAMMRHYLEHQAGRTLDVQTGKPHLAHALCRLGMALSRHLEAPSDG